MRQIIKDMAFYTNNISTAQSLGDGMRFQVVGNNDTYKVNEVISKRSGFIANVTNESTQETSNECFEFSTLIFVL